MTLSVHHTISHGISQSVIEIWKRNGIDTLLPLQETAIREHGFLRGENLIVFSPTSSGKTFIAEMAAIKHLQSNKKVVYLVPTKALAEEKHRTLTKLYSELGYRIVVATRERPETDRLVLNGKYDLLIAIYEKMKAYLVIKPEILASVGLLVVDELQMMGESSRGDIIDMMLTKIKRSPYKMQIIGLSAVLGDASHIATWLNCDLLIFKKRPVELREGVFNLADNHFHYRRFNSGEEGKEKFNFYFDTFCISEDDSFYRETIFSLAKELAEVRGEQVIIFVPMRSTTRAWTQMLAPKLTLDSADAAIGEIDGYENTHSKELLISALSRGIAFHNADLSWELRNLIEEHFNDGTIRILVSTSTLGQGVNLSGRNAIIVHKMIATDEWTGNYTLVPLSRQRFRNQGGRIARYTKGMDFGRSILVARNKEEVDTLMKEYVRSEFEPLSLPLVNKKLDVYILDLVASNIYRRKDELSEFFVDTYSGTRRWNIDSADYRKLIDEGISSCLEKKMIVEDEEGNFSSSGIGKIAAINGIKPLTLLRFHQFLKTEDFNTVTPLELLLVVSFTPDAGDFSIYLTYQERNLSDYINCVKEIISADHAGSAVYLRQFLEKGGGYTKDDIAAIKKALLLNEWISERETREIEDNFKIYAGTISNLGAHFNWLLQTMAAIAMALALPSGFVKSISALAERLIYGVDEEGLELTQLRVPSLSRTYINILARNGFNSIESLANVDPSILPESIPEKVGWEIVFVASQIFPAKHDDGLLEPIVEINVSKDEIPDTQNALVEKHPISLEESEAESQPNGLDRMTLEIDTNSPQIVFLNGQKVRLTKMPYNLLVVLARRPGKCISYEDIDRSLWADYKVEQQQIFAHKRTIIRAFARVVGEDLANRTIIALSGSGLMLCLKPSLVNVYG